MKNVFLAIAILLLAAGTAYAKDYEAVKKAGEYDVVITIDKNPPVVGKNNITVKVKDANGKFVADAAVNVEYSMPAMPGMPAMNYKTSAELKGSEYKAKMNLSMAGPWNIAVRIARGGKTATARLNVDVQ